MSNLQPGQMIGPYQIINQIGQGGMATVYKAYHAAMDRYVAVKVLPYQFAQSEQFLGRFKQEVRLIASLEHIHILPVYDYGENEGIPYLVMRHLDGGTLKDRIQPSGQDRSAPLTLEKIDQFFAPLAEALDYAHRRGVIHRDIKPANVMLDQEEKLFLTDFGIAKLVEGSVQFTASGAITGTPAYMSPEQGEGKPLDLRTDIYSLGIVLYEMLTGRVPFSAETPMAVVIKHMQEPLPPPSSIKPDIDPDIEAVVLKALAKNRDDRFASMHDFLVAWKKALEKIRQTQLRETTYRVPLGISVSKAPETTSGEEATIDEFVPLPITKSSSSSQSVASTISTTLQSAPKWLLPVIGLGGISLIVVLVLTIGPLFFNPADNKPSTSLESSNGTLLTTETSLLSSTTAPGPTLATLPPLLLPEQRDMYAGTFAGPAPPEAWARLGKGTIHAVAISPKEDFLVVGSSIGIYIYQMNPLKLVSYYESESSIFSVVYSPTGEMLASGTYGIVNLWDARSGKLLQSIEVGEGYEINCLAFSPDGETLATGSYYDPINLWDVRSGEKKHTLILEEQQLYSLAFSPDGSTLAAGYYDKKLVLWDTRSGVKIDTLEGEGTAYTGFSKDGSRLVSAAIYDVSLWDAERKTLINRFETTHSSGINDTAISPDGQIIATAANDETVMLWDTTGTQVATLEGHSDDVIDLVYLQSGTELVSASSNEVILWDINAGTAQDIIQGFTGQVLSLTFAPAGDALATGSWYNNLILWDIHSGEQLHSLKGSSDEVNSVAFSPDGETLVSGSFDGNITLWNPQAMEKLSTIEADLQVVNSVAFSPDGTILASGGRDDHITLWDAHTGEHLRTLTGHSDDVLCIAFSPDGTMLASGSSDKTVIIWNPQTGERLRTLEGFEGDVASVAISPDGKTLAVKSAYNTVIIWDIQSGKQQRTLEGWGSISSHSLAYSPDGSILAMGTGRQVMLWNALSGEKLHTFDGHKADINCLAYSPDGSMLASGGQDGTVIFWSLEE